MKLKNTLATIVALSAISSSVVVSNAAGTGVVADATYTAEKLTVTAPKLTMALKPGGATLGAAASGVKSQIECPNILVVNSTVDIGVSANFSLIAKTATGVTLETDKDKLDDIDGKGKAGKKAALWLEGIEKDASKATYNATTAAITAVAKGPWIVPTAKDGTTALTTSTTAQYATWDGRVVVIDTIVANKYDATKQIKLADFLKLIKPGINDELYLTTTAFGAATTPTLASFNGGTALAANDLAKLVGTAGTGNVSSVNAKPSDWVETDVAPVYPAFDPYAKGALEAATNTFPDSFHILGAGTSTEFSAILGAAGKGATATTAVVNQEIGWTAFTVAGILNSNEAWVAKDLSLYLVYDFKALSPKAEDYKFESASVNHRLEFSDATLKRVTPVNFTAGKAAAGKDVDGKDNPFDITITIADADVDLSSCTVKYTGMAEKDKPTWTGNSDGTVKISFASAATATAPGGGLKAGLVDVSFTKGAETISTTLYIY